MDSKMLSIFSFNHFFTKVYTYLIALFSITFDNIIRKSNAKQVEQKQRIQLEEQVRNAAYR